MSGRLARAWLAAVLGVPAADRVLVVLAVVFVVLAVAHAAGPAVALDASAAESAAQLAAASDAAAAASAAAAGAGVAAAAAPSTAFAFGSATKQTRKEEASELLLSSANALDSTTDLLDLSEELVRASLSESVPVRPGPSPNTLGSSDAD